MVIHSVETVGMADTHLQRTQSVIAKTAAPSGGGKNPDMTLYALKAEGASILPRAAHPGMGFRLVAALAACAGTPRGPGAGDRETC